MTSRPMIDPLGRRRAMIGAAAIGAMSVLGIGGSCHAQELIAEPDGDVRGSLQAALANGNVLLNASARPYRLSGPVRIPAGRRLRCEGGVRFVYTGAVGSAVEPAGVFVIDGDGVTLEGVGGDLTVECASDSPFLWAVLGRAVSSLRVTAVRGQGCGHVRLGPADARYAAVATARGSRMICRDVTISGGGASFARSPSAGEGACMITYTLGWTLRDASYRRVAHGVQWWGGNAWPGVADGAPDNERKCADFMIANVSVEDATFAGIWGSMGRNGRVEDCRIARCGDVGFDAEGCHGIQFARCVARDAVNGCFAVFFLNRDIAFVDCVGSVTDRRRPLFRVFNQTQSCAGTGLVAIRGGRFECTDTGGTATLDTGAGPTARLEIVGATLTNARIDTANFNMHDTRIANNQLRFPFGTPDAPAIRAGAAKSLGGAGSTLIENNSITSTGTRVSAAAAIHVVEDDYNSSASDVIRGNRIAAAFADAIVVENASANVGVRPRFLIAGNILGAAAGIRVRIARAGASRPDVTLSGNKRTDGHPVDRLDG